MLTTCTETRCVSLGVSGGTAPTTHNYLAIADDLDCEFWTVDERLFHAVRERLPLIHWLGAV